MALIFGTGIAVPVVIEKNAIYVDGITGSDENVGTVMEPVKTIGKALELVSEKTKEIFVIEGTFNEEIIIDKNDVIIEGAENSNALITSGENLDGQWEKYKKNIYRIPVSESVESVFLNGEQMNIARWPNTSVNDLCHMKRAKTDEGTNMTTLCDKSLPKVDLTGATLVLWSGGEWVPFCREISSCTKGKSISWEVPVKSSTDDNPEGMDCYVPDKQNDSYYVCNSLALLDSAGEWFYDKNDGFLYLCFPCGKSPKNSEIQIKKRTCGITIKADNVAIKNIDVFGCGVKCHGNNCSLDDVNVKCSDYFVNANYFDQDSHISVLVDGKNNIWKNSEISDTWGSGITLWGENNTVENCLIHDVCYAGGYYGCVSERGVENSVVNCTMFNSGRYLVLHNGIGIKILGCEGFSACLLSKDCGATYTWGTNGMGAEIAYNYFHDNREVAIYLDNNCSDYYVHDNLIKNNGTGITLNSQALNDKIENNIFIKNEKTSSTYCYDKDEPSMAGTEIKNNIYTGKWKLVEGENAPVFENNKSIKTTIGLKLPERNYGCDFYK